MRLLLDTHIALWAVTDAFRITNKGRQLISEPENSVYFSAVSIWELAIKLASGKPGAPPFGALKAIAAFKEAGYIELTVTTAHAAAVEMLPLLHRDPFDRLLIGQALAEPLQLLTRDRTVAAYGGSILLV